MAMREIDIYRLRNPGRAVRMGSVQAASLRKALESYYKNIQQPNGFTEPVFVGNTLSVIAPSGTKIEYEAREVRQ